MRATQHGHTLQAQMWEILNSAVKPEGRVRLGDLLEGIGRRVKLTDEEAAVFERDRSLARAVR